MGYFLKQEGKNSKEMHVILTLFDYLNNFRNMHLTSMNQYGKGALENETIE
jgi:hypothetical protein